MKQNGFLTHDEALKLGETINNTEVIPQALVKIIHQKFEAYSYLYSLIERKS